VPRAGLVGLAGLLDQVKRGRSLAHRAADQAPGDLAVDGQQRVRLAVAGVGIDRALVLGYHPPGHELLERGDKGTPLGLAVRLAEVDPGLGGGRPGPCHHLGQQQLLGRRHEGGEGQREVGVRPRGERGARAAFQPAAGVAAEPRLVQPGKARFDGEPVAEQLAELLRELVGMPADQGELVRVGRRGHERLPEQEPDGRPALRGQVLGEVGHPASRRRV
jgi:hypothetical protein